MCYLGSEASVLVGGLRIVRFQQGGITDQNHWLKLSRNIKPFIQVYRHINTESKRHRVSGDMGNLSSRKKGSRRMQS